MKMSSKWINSIQIFLDNGGDINRQDEYLNTLLIDAIKHQKLDVCRFLLSKGADPNVWGPGTCPLFLAIERDQLEMVECLLDHGALVNEPGVDENEGRIPLHIALKPGNRKIPIIKLLLDRGADVEYPDCWGITPLIDAKCPRYIDRGDQPRYSKWETDNNAEEITNLVKKYQKVVPV